MPCDCSHLKANEHEEESRKVSEFIVFVCKKLRKKPDPLIVKTAKDYYGNPGQVHELTDMLCGLCRSMKPKEADLIIYNGRDATSRRLADWWDLHKKADKKKRA